MMENLAETCNKSFRNENLAETCQKNVNELKGCVTAISNEENYNFGAEITKQVNVDDEDAEIKTITSTKTEQPCAVAAATTTIITETAASDSGISLEKCQSDNCDYDTAEDDMGEDEADDENEEDSRDEDSPTPYQAHNSHPSQIGSIDSSDDDTSTSTDSDFSDISGLSDVSGKEWKPVNRKPIHTYIQKQIHSGRNPRELLSRFLPASAQSITLGLNDMSLWRLLANMLSEPPRRQKLRYINTFEDVIKLILNSKNIVVLTGAGVSVSCGIPDFRSSDGIYSRLAKDYPNLPDPQAMFDIDYFSRDPRPFYKFAREIYPGQFKPSPCHRFIKLLEEKQLLLRNYTQNIDTLEQVAGIKRVIECHGSFSTASCTKCKYKCDADAIRADIFTQRIPVCPRCQPHVHQSVDASEPVSEYDLRWIVANGIMKPDIVFFGEGLPDEFHKVMASDKDKCDLLIVIGSSLKVRPVALIPSSLPANVPQILINREQLNHLEFDVELLGDSDVIINQICHRLGADWKQICFDERVLQESKELQPFDNEDCTDDGDDDEDNMHNEFDDVDENKTANKVHETVSENIEKIKTDDAINFLAAAETTTACTDSGFETTTSIGQTECGIAGTATTANIKIRNVDELAQIENIKTSILEFSERPHASDETDDFQPFSVRLGQDTLMTPPTSSSTSTSFTAGSENLRHLSIDSTKDSGIQCDSSNSMATTTTLSAEIDDFACSSSLTAVTALKSPTTINETTEHTKRQESNLNDDDVDAQSHGNTTTTNTTTRRKLRKSRSCSAAEFLIDGTYYYHKNSSSYVFPGAQISWYADDSDTDLEEDNCVGTKTDEVEAINDDGAADFGGEISAKCDTKETAAEVGASKRAATVKLTEINETPVSPPPAKKCRLDAELTEITPAATAILTTTINTNAVDDCSDNDASTNPQALETNITKPTTNTTLTLQGSKEALKHI